MLGDGVRTNFETAVTTQSLLTPDSADSWSRIRVLRDSGWSDEDYSGYWVTEPRARQGWVS